MERNQQSGHSHSFPVMENVSPDTENGVRGQSAKATERVRSPMLWIRICFLRATSDLQLGQRKQVSAPPSAEGGGGWKAHSYSCFRDTGTVEATETWSGSCRCLNSCWGDQVAAFLNTSWSKFHFTQIIQHQSWSSERRLEEHLLITVL